MKRLLYVSLILLALVACAKREDIYLLDSQIESTRKQIYEAENELKKYGEGSVLHAVVIMRASIYKQTLAMLEQKKASHLFYVKLDYQVNGTAYKPPEDVPGKILALEKDLAGALADLDSAKKKAQETGGLIQLLASMNAETKALQVSQLQYQLIALRNGFPPMIAVTQAENLNIPVVEPGQSPRTTDERPSDIVSPPSKKQLEIEMMQSALSVRFISKKFTPKNFDKRRYENWLGLVFECKNNSDKEIRAFTGKAVFMDIFERPFLRVRWTGNSRIKPGAQLVDNEGGISVNEFEDSHTRLVTEDIENLKFRFEPTSILFSDGSKLGSVSEE